MTDCYLVGLVAQTDVLALQVHLIHSNPAAGRGVLADAGLNHGGPRQARCFTVIVIQSALLGAGNSRGVPAARGSVGVQQAAVCRAGCPAHSDFSGGWGGGQTQPANTNTWNRCELCIFWPCRKDLSMNLLYKVSLSSVFLLRRITLNTSKAFIFK